MLSLSTLDPRISTDRVVPKSRTWVGGRPVGNDTVQRSSAVTADEISLAVTTGIFDRSLLERIQE